MKIFKKYLSVCAAWVLLAGGVSSCAPVKLEEAPNVETRKPSASYTNQNHRIFQDDDLRRGIIQIREALNAIETDSEQIRKIVLDAVPRNCNGGGFITDCEARKALYQISTKILDHLNIKKYSFVEGNSAEGFEDGEARRAIIDLRIRVENSITNKIRNVENIHRIESVSRNQKISLQIKNTQPNNIGDFIINIQANTDVASLTINGEEQNGRADGKYSIKKIARAGGDTQFTIVATDINGNTDTKTITVSRPVADSKLIVAALNPAQVKRQPERDSVAIIIGIADYKNLPRADFANDDARVFYDYAIRALGVKPENIKLLVDGDADDIGIYQAFKTWLPSRVRNSTDVYVYYSGHGLPTADGQGMYLLPQRAHRDFIDKTAITQAEINAAIQAAKPKSVTVFLDSCYSGQARSGETLIASARPVALKTAKQMFPDNFTVITASQADQISSSSPDLKHGIFSYYLMRGMEGDADANRDGKITAGEMQAYLAENVSRQAGMQNRVQQPQLIGDVNRVLVGR